MELATDAKLICSVYFLHVKSGYGWLQSHLFDELQQIIHIILLRKRNQFGP